MSNKAQSIVLREELIKEQGSIGRALRGIDRALRGIDQGTKLDRWELLSIQDSMIADSL